MEVIAILILFFSVVLGLSIGWVLHRAVDKQFDKEADERKEFQDRLKLKSWVNAIEELKRCRRGQR